MSSIDAGANASEVAHSSANAVTQPHRRQASVASIIGGFLLTGVFLALSAGAFSLSIVFGFIWWAQH